ncbi:MAG: PEP-CTERM sorting domain-containing protein [Pseudomonadota bacterium]
MNMKLNKTLSIIKSISLATIVSACMVSSAVATEAAQSPIDPSTLAMFAIGLASLVATRRRVR